MQADNKTFLVKKETVKPQWFVVDATDKILGRLASRVATILMGKHRPTYTPHVDTGDFIIMINADKIKISGRKLEDKNYRKYTGYSDGLREIPMQIMLKNKPEKVIYLAVKRMLPQTKLGDHMIKKLKVYAGSKYPHQAQNPKVLEL